MSNINYYTKYANLYKESLLLDIIPYWIKNSPDEKYGGYFTCLARDGSVYDTDKFVWLQGRQVWTFSFLYDQVDKKPEWLAMAELGAGFLYEHVFDDWGNAYFSLTRKGQPLIQPYNIFSDCFIAMAFGRFGKIKRDDSYIQSARGTFRNILKRKNNPKGKYEKSTGVRAIKGFGLPMIISNLVLELEDILSESEVEVTIQNCKDEIVNQFIDPETHLVYENLSAAGKPVDTYEGRLMNPGHGIEAMWFLMDIGRRKNDQKLISLCRDVLLSILEYSWDKEYGGIFYFLDRKAYPPQQLEWDQKLWWVHLETLVALSKAFLYTKDKKIWQWYEKVHNYAWERFPDPEYGEWYGYLNRQGKPLLNLKGGKWKGCFHVPRALYQCWRTFEQLKSQEDTGKG